MKITKIIYKRVFALPGYENKKVGVEIELNENDNVNDAFLEAIDQVEKHNPKAIDADAEIKLKEAYENAKITLNNWEQHSTEDCTKALNLIKAYQHDDFLFKIDLHN